jgi:hypothetical protein
VFADLWQWAYDLSISATVRESSWVYPTFECIHLYSMVFLIGLVAAFDLRLMGIALEPQPVSHFSKLVRRWVWIPLGINAVTGTLLFAAKAPEYSANIAFVVKMSLLFIGVTYHVFIIRKANHWDHLVKMPLTAKALGGLSLVLWVGVVGASRWIAYVY